MNHKFDFSDRATYLIWASEWKADYAEHSQMIVALKRDFKGAQRNSHHGKINEMRHALDRAKRLANVLIGMRHASKIEAQRQYLAERAGA